MEKLNSAPVEIVSDDIDENEILIEKSDLAKQIESFDIHNLTPENIELMNHAIQDIFHEHFPVDSELIDKISNHMKIVDGEEFVRLRQETKEDADMDLGFYSTQLDQMLINASKHNTPGGLFSTMFHESLHFVSIQSGAGLTGDFSYPDIGEEETEELRGELDDGVRTMVEGTTQNITQAYILDYLGFNPQPEMFGYEPETQITSAIWEGFSRDDRLKIYFNTPLELLRVRFEDTFVENYDVDRPTGEFANCLVDVSRAKKQMESALDSWRKDGDPDPVEEVLSHVRHAVGFFIMQDAKVNGKELSEEDIDDLRDYVEPYLAKE